MRDLSTASTISFFRTLVPSPLSLNHFISLLPATYVCQKATVTGHKHTGGPTDKTRQTGGTKAGRGKSFDRRLSRGLDQTAVRCKDEDLAFKYMPEFEHCASSGTKQDWLRTRAAAATTTTAALATGATAKEGLYRPSTPQHAFSTGEGTFVATTTLCLVRVFSHFPKAISVLPCVSALGGTGYISAAS